MGDQDKGKILAQAANLPPLQRAMAEGYMQGLTAAAGVPAGSAAPAATDNEEEVENG